MAVTEPSLISSKIEEVQDICKETPADRKVEVPVEWQCPTLCIELGKHCFSVHLFSACSSITVICKVSILLCIRWFSKIYFTSLQNYHLLGGLAHTLICI